MSITNTISLLRKIIFDPNCDRMNKSTVKGFLGELIVKERLEEIGFEVEHQGNQSGYDLSFWMKDEDSEIKIDVKTSTLKDEFSCGRRHWGWALIHSNKQKPVTATHFVCVGLDDDLEPKKFIIIPANWARKFPKGLGQFNMVEHALCCFQTSEPAKGLAPKKRDYIKKCQTWLGHKRIKHLSRGQSFRNAFY